MSTPFSILLTESAASGFWWVDQSSVFPQSVYFWIQAVLFKIIPCILLVILSSLLVQQMRKVSANVSIIKIIPCILLVLALYFPFTFPHASL